MSPRAINFRFFIWVNHHVFDVLYRQIPHIDTPDNMSGVVESVFRHGALPDTIGKANESSFVFTTAQNFWRALCTPLEDKDKLPAARRVRSRRREDNDGHRDRRR